MVKTSHILLIVENNSVPEDGRVWSEALVAKEMGMRVSVISPVSEQSRKKYEILDGIDVYRHPNPIEGSKKWEFVIEYVNAFWWELFLSIKIYLKNRFHIIHSANPPDHVFLIALPFKCLGVKFIFDHHDLSPENYVAKFQKKDMMYRAMLIMERLCFWTADVTIATNESYRKVAIVRGKKNPDIVHVVRNGPALEKVLFKSPRPELKQGFEFMVAYLGKIAKQDNVDSLLEIIDCIVHYYKFTKAIFYIVGTGTQWRELVDTAEHMNLSNYTRFTGFVPFDKLYEILSTADLCVNPEHCNEFTDKSTMGKIMEYMIFGKPIVQFLTTEGKATARDASLYIENNDKQLFASSVIDLLNDSDSRQKMGAFAEKRLKNELCWEQQKESLRNVYRQIIS
jgi:glycosyltransferase involved in cell wall biosynthesis